MACGNLLSEKKGQNVTYLCQISLKSVLEKPRTCHILGWEGKTNTTFARWFVVEDFPQKAVAVLQKTGRVFSDVTFV